MSRSKAGFILPHQGVAEAPGGAVRSDVQSQKNTMILQRYHMKKGSVFLVFLVTVVNLMFCDLQSCLK